MNLTAILVLVVVGVSLVAIIVLARRRAWNADGSDDARRLDQEGCAER